MSTPVLRGYSQWVAITIKPINFDIAIQDAYLEYGKFYKDNDKSVEMSIDDVNKITIKKGKSATIYSCGRQTSPTGTQGEFTVCKIEDDKSYKKIGKMHWDCPYFFMSDNSWGFDNNEEDEFMDKLKGGSKDGAIGHLTLTLMEI